MAPAEPVSRLRSIPRRASVLWIIARRPGRVPKSGAELRERFERLAEGVAEAGAAPEIARFLWRVESLAFHHLLGAADWPDFSDSRWPRQALPMAHSGLGMAAALVTRFDPVALTQRIEATAAPGFREFAWEAVGSLVGVLSHSGFRLAVHLARIARLLRLPERPSVPPLVLADLPPLPRRLAAHGYGRHLLFLHSRVGSALAAAQELVVEERGAAMRGVAGAYALVNVRELGAAVRVGEALEAREREALDDGIVNALTLLVWTRERALDALIPPPPRTAHLVRRAREIAAESGPESLGILVGSRA